eukprot:TRINITY_DN876_c1_g1_i11.p2 TRINITY_DN876_c1_g1~~TRINITY_DN876_c1_g1_i11.p2  ORF type:complete len:158 (+),score=30.95 TRINITY_DN876_c1_g1_i11:1558-2031(+)
MEDTQDSDLYLVMAAVRLNGFEPQSDKNREFCEWLLQSLAKVNTHGEAVQDAFRTALERYKHDGAVPALPDHVNKLIEGLVLDDTVEELQGGGTAVLPSVFTALGTAVVGALLAKQLREKTLKPDGTVVEKYTSFVEDMVKHTLPGPAPVDDSQENK